MKKFYSIKLLLCALLLAIGCNAWGDDIVWDFENEELKDIGSGSTLEVSSKVTTGYTLSITASSKDDKISNDKPSTVIANSSVNSNVNDVYNKQLYLNGTTNANRKVAFSGISGDGYLIVVSSNAPTSESEGKIILSKVSGNSVSAQNDIATINASGKIAPNTAYKSAKISGLDAGTTYYVNFTVKTYVRAIIWSPYEGGAVDPTITAKNGECELGVSFDVSTLFESNSSGEMSYTILSAPEEADYTLIGSNFEGRTYGLYTVKVSQAATTEYNAGTQSATLIVKPYEQICNKILSVADFGYSYWGLVPGKDSQEKDSTYTQRASILKQDGIVLFDVNQTDSKATKPRFEEHYIRMYDKNTLTISVPEGWTLSSVTFIEPAKEKSWGGNISVNSGLYLDEDKKWYETSTVSSVAFTFGKTNRIGGIIVKVYNADYVADITISTAQYATYYISDKAYTMPKGIEGLVVYEVNGTSLNLQTAYEEGDVVPAGEPLILHSTTVLETSTTLQLYAGETLDPTYKSVDMNLLSGTSTADEWTTGGEKYYRLSQHNGEVGFYWGAAEGGKFQPGANKAYLAIPAGTSAPARFIFGQQGVPTDLLNVNDNNQSTKVLRDGRLYIIREGKTYDSLGRLVK